MKKIDSLIIYAVISIPILFVALFFIWGNFYGPNRQELFMKNSLALTINGKIDSIYNDKQNHNARTVVLENGYKYELYDYWTLYFDVGDSISKVKGSYKLLIYKKNNKVITLDYKNLEKMFKK